MLITYDAIKPYIAQRLISEQAHPEYPDIRIFNYTPECQFSRAWDEVTMRCRGLILNVATGKIVANPFPKFFNYGEYQGDIPNTIPEVTEKLDGSLGISYWLPGDELPRIATRGSFTSEQARWGTQWLRGSPCVQKLFSGFTYLFEIIYPSNRIVVRYDFSELVHLATRITTTGEEISLPSIPFRQPRAISSTDLATLSQMDEPNSEGFVVHYREVGLRLKIKFAEYLRLHRILTQVSVKAIYEMMRDGQDLTPLLTQVPDEFYAWITEVTSTLSDQFSTIEQAAAEDFRRLQTTWHVTETPRKNWAEAILQCRYPHVLFKMLDGKPYQELIWKVCKPQAGELTFKQDEV